MIHYYLLFFIIGAEVLSRALNKLNENVGFKGYRLPKWSRKINHLYHMWMTIFYFVLVIENSWGR